MKSLREISEDGEWEIPKQELTIYDLIGKGSFGVVKRGVWRGTDVALKILKDDNVDLKEFIMELNILSRLHHPNVLQMLGASTICTPYVIVMEYMKNNSLEKNKNDLTYNIKIDILKDVSQGLAYLHNRKPQCIIHRDLKPSNILLTQSYKAKIADFGISCLQVSSNENYKMTGETGTYTYMAPEVLNHQKYSSKVDIWSFGMILHYMFIGKPYDGFSIKILLQDVVSNQLNIPLHLLSNDLKIAFINCAKYEPDLRWDSLLLVNYCRNELQYKDKQLKKKCCLF